MPVTINDMILGGGIIFVLGLLVIAILTMIGMGYVTSVAFENKKWESTVDLNYI